SLLYCTLSILFIFINDTTTSDSYTLSYTTLFRSSLEMMRATVQGRAVGEDARFRPAVELARRMTGARYVVIVADGEPGHDDDVRSEEHTSELQSRFDLVCRLLLETKKTAKPPAVN